LDWGVGIWQRDPLRLDVSVHVGEPSLDVLSSERFKGPATQDGHTGWNTD